MKYYNTINLLVIYIESRLRSDISYEDLEKNTGFSLVHIRSIFKNFYNVPLAQYILQRKIANAAHDIKYSKTRITDVAYSYGFECYDSFTRAFKRIIGITPSQYRKSPCDVSIGYISSGVYAPVINKKGGKTMERNMSNKSNKCILFGVPEVDFGYGVNSSFPSCLKAALDYLGQNTSYDYLMTTCGTAFRIRWNTEFLDLGNVDIMNLYEDDYKPFDLCFNAVGRQYSILKRDSKTTKDDLIKFITEEIDQGRPCVALGIVGPSEACLITGYRKDGEELLGYSMFQNEPQFCSNTTIDDSGYFVCSDWWENKHTKAVMSIGEHNDITIELKDIINTAIAILDCNRIKRYAGGQSAYDAIIDFMSNDDNWSKQVLQAQLYEHIIAFGDAMVMMCNRKSAANFFEDYEHSNKDISAKLKNIAKILKSISVIPEKMTAILGGWDMSEKMLENICKSETRRQMVECLVRIKDLEKRTLALLNEIMLSLQ